MLPFSASTPYFVTLQGSTSPTFALSGILSAKILHSLSADRQKTKTA